MTLPTSVLSPVVWSRHQPPVRQPATLARPELIQLIDDVVDQHPVTVVTAPSGFGKTTAVAAWAERSPRLVAWLAIAPLDEGSVDEGIVAALESVLPPDRMHDVDSYGLAPAPLDLRRRLEAVLAGVLEPFVLVIDDVQRAHESLEAGLLAALLARTPAALRIVLVGTTALEARIPRFILSNPDAVIGAEALAFEAHEVVDLAAAMTSTADAAAVHADTAGWPIAVRLALLSGAARSRGADRSRGLMRDYVRDVILSALEPELARFVVDATVCGELTPRLAVELTGRPDAARLLEECRRLGLFLDRHDGPSGVEYRWHALFARHCLELLAEEDPARLERMRRRAGALLSEERPLEAVGHLLEVGDGEGAARVILDAWVRLVMGSAAAALDRACLSLPARLIDSTSIQLVRACARDVLGEHKAARELFARAEADAADDGSSQRTLDLARLFFLDDRSRLGATLTAVRGHLVEGEASASERAAITFLVGWTELIHRVQPEQVVETLESAVRKAEAVGDRALARRARECLAYALAWAGRFRETRPLLTALADEDPEESTLVAYVGGSGGVAAGVVALWAHDLPRAEQEFRRVIAFGGGSRMFSDFARILLAASASATGDARLCRRAALELQFLPRTEAQGIAWPRYRQLAVALLEEGVGHRDRALELARGLTDETSMPLLAALVAGILRRTGAYSDALQLLRRLTPYAGVSYIRVSTLVTNALAQWSAGRTDTAHELCEEALAQAETEGIRLPFSENDPELRELLGAHVAWGTRHEDFVLSCLRPGASGTAMGALSERERDVFEQLRTTLTTIEIADKLGVSVNTVKTHQRSIYRKLGVTSRREALRQYT
ncbi:LuxR C-terminal-related transcriptional regulator [Microbacterium sp. SS28]|uniref:LuxR C-terminal-related transcriptional regulator n=1 Tax=Microbacterium sp. SS28 TaxID=2919948 RepID=UPI001FA95F49|nr:LuxR C-terminal-related transcriptional regulator [Microbacterium sp. SS28]